MTRSTPQSAATASAGQLCGACGLRFFGGEGAACPRCKRVVGSVGTGHAPAPHAGLPRELVDEARTRLLVWNDDPSAVQDKLVSKGVSPEAAREVVAALAAEIHARSAPAARAAGALHLAIGVGIGGLGGGLLYAYGRSIADGLSWFPNFFTGSMLVGGVVLSLIGLGLMAGGLSAIVSGVGPED